MPIIEFRPPVTQAELRHLTVMEWKAALRSRVLDPWAEEASAPVFGGARAPPKQQHEAPPQRSVAPPQGASKTPRHQRNRSHARGAIGSTHGLSTAAEIDEPSRSYVPLTGGSASQQQHMIAPSLLPPPWSSKDVQVNARSAPAAGFEQV